MKKNIFKPIEKETCKVELISVIFYILAFTFGTVETLQNVVFSAINNERQIDYINCVLSLLFLLFILSYKKVLSYRLLIDYSYVIEGILYANAILWSDKITIWLTIAVFLFELSYLLDKLEYVLKILLCGAILIELIGLWYIFNKLAQITKLDYIIIGWPIDIVTILLLILHILLQGKSSFKLSDRFIKICRVICLLFSIVAIVGFIYYGIKNVEGAYVLEEIRKHSIKTGFAFCILVVGIICVLLKCKVEKVFTIHQWKSHMQYILFLIGAIIVIAGQIIQLFNDNVIEYNLEDVKKGNIVLKGFSIDEQNYLISNEDDAWIIVYRKDDKKEAIRNIVINIDECSNENEIGQCFVFSNEDDWSENIDSINFKIKTGKTIVSSNKLKNIKDYFRIDMTGYRDAKIKINSIEINNFSEQFKVITYIGVIIIVWALILTVNKICKKLK